jgi:hypothetical protein
MDTIVELIVLLFKLAVAMCGLALIIFIGVYFVDFFEKSNLPKWISISLGMLVVWFLFYLSDKLLLHKSTKNNNK